MSKKYQFGILVGRFQNLHKGHENMINTALALCEEVAVFVGSANESGTFKNPFTYEQRSLFLNEVYGDKIAVFPLFDIGVGNNSKWGDYVIKTVFDTVGRYPDLIVSGREERRGSWYDNFDIDEIFVEKTTDISASEIRSFLLLDNREEFKKFTNEKLWKYYEFMKDTVCSVKDKLDTESI